MAILLHTQRKNVRMSNNKVEEEKVNEEVQDTTTQENAAENKTETTEANADEPINELAEAKKKYDELNDKYVRLFSDFDNFRRRNAQEKLTLIENAGSDIAKEMLAVLDDFDRAIENNETATDIDGVKEGFKLIHSKLFKTLESKGVKAMNSKGNAFDTDLHEAITHMPAPSEDLKGKVVEVAEKGYYFREKVLRFAKVVIGQ
jgi:molecular chaperone GrpE